MSLPKSFRTFADFEREFIRPGMAVGQTVEDLLDDSPFEREFELDRDPFDEDEEEDEES